MKRMKNLALLLLFCLNLTVTSCGTAEKPEIETIVQTKEETEMNESTPASAVLVSGTNADVTTDSGLIYTADGFSEYSDTDKAFTINQNFTIDFAEGTFAQDFNRFGMTYTSTEPLECSITYTEDGTERSDRFFLEAGEHRFNCLTESYLSGKTGREITRINVSTCEEKEAQFFLQDLTAEKYTVYSNDTYYMGNARFKIGIRLMWGGGICYISDVRNPVDGLTNLVNQADTGRLIQQSYYGTGANGEYTPGRFNNSNWSYNPVQGGDQYQNHSRIIDIVVDENSVYVKSQPQDWSLNNQITPSYMENTYTLCDDYIRVDNRFVDFSGWTHPYSHQELPAFYTVSYLDKFTWYDGSKPWTGDKLSSRSDLNFWGDPQYSGDCRFYIKDSNTETWCAWTNKDIDYGIGLYVPNADTYFAGKHAYNGSMDPGSGACNYVAPVNQIRMVSYQPIEYSYLMTTGSVEDIRAIFTENRDFADNASLHENYMSLRVSDDTPDRPADMTVDMETLDFTRPETFYQITASNNTDISYDSAESALKLTADVGFDVQTTLEYRNSEPVLKAEDYTKITIEYKIPASNAMSSYDCELFLCTGDQQNAAAGKSVTGTYIADGEYHTVELDLTGLDFWKGKINAVRFDYFNGCADGDAIYIRSIKLS